LSFDGRGGFRTCDLSRVKRLAIPAIHGSVEPAGGGAAAFVSGQSAYTEANLWKDLASAREQLADTAGTRLRATTMLTTTDLYGSITRQVDKTTERPIWPP
jgi:hypothetical protein